MNTHSISDILSFHTLVVGSGAAGLRASECLYDLGCRDTALITVGVGLGTSFNTGSDKQTYYKLSLSGSERDSVREMAQTLFDGQAVDGDTALCEAASSAASFFHLTELGVPPRYERGPVHRLHDGESTGKNRARKRHTDIRTYAGDKATGRKRTRSRACMPRP